MLTHCTSAHFSVTDALILCAGVKKREVLLLSDSDDDLLIATKSMSETKWQCNTATPLPLDQWFVTEPLASSPKKKRKLINQKEELASDSSPSSSNLTVSPMDLFPS